MAKVYLGLGSNLGDRQKNIEGAIKELTSCHVVVRKKSTVIESKPQGGPPQGNFLNAVVEAETILSPLDLLQGIKAIEKRLGRIKTVVNGPRTVDIDILLYDNIKMTSSDLTIPHPRMMEREFVLTPLREIAPALKVFQET